MRLIDADALWDAVREIELPRGAYFVAVELQKAFDAAPTIDAVPVVHGRWIEQPDETHFCSECGKDALLEQYDKYCFHEKLTDICPNCGARMDLEAQVDSGSV